jgi:lysophospholipase L1-like esterase
MITGSVAQHTPLRIMCLGASITKGEHSTGEVGFRRTIRNDLAALDMPVNMVGSVRLGSDNVTHFVDNDVEAFGGYRIINIDEAAAQVVPWTQPNVYVVNVGTNNVLQVREIANASVYMRQFVERLLDGSEGSFVVMSTLVPCTIPDRPQCERDILELNRQYRVLADEFTRERKRVLLVEMHSPDGSSGTEQGLGEADIGPDGMHPTDSGYDLMGRIFVKGILDAIGREWLRPPAYNASIPDDGTAERAAEIASLLPN